MATSTKARVLTFQYHEAEDTTSVLLDGRIVGAMWMTDRGACYEHGARRLRLGADELAVIVNHMRVMERA